MKRAGLDYWPMVEVKIYDSLQELQEKYSGSRYFYVTTRGRQSYFQFDYQPGDFIVFGRETSGLPEELIAANMNACMRIPMVKGSRSLNLANSVAIIVYEGLRKHMFINLC